MGCLTSPDTDMLSALAPACAAHCDHHERPQTQPPGAGLGSRPGEGGGRTEIKQIMYIYLNLISYAQSRYFVAIGCKEIDIPNCCKKTLKLFRKTLTPLI